MFTTFIKIFQIVEDLWLIPYLGFDISAVSENWHLASPLARFCWYQSVCETHQSILKVPRVMGIFVNILASVKKKVTFGILRFLCLELANINTHTKFYQIIPYS